MQVNWQQRAHSICVSSKRLPVDYPPTPHSRSAIPSAQSRYVRTVRTHTMRTAHSRYAEQGDEEEHATDDPVGCRSLQNEA